MKYTLCVVGLVCSLVAIGCGKDEAATVTITQAEYDELKGRVDKLDEYVKGIEERTFPRIFQDLSEIEYMERDPRFLLWRMDRDLEAAEQGKETHGSFSDYFVPNAAKALEAGASRKDITTRIDRVIALAEKKIYLSGFVAQLMKEGGPTAVRSYVDEWIRGSQQQ